jgi:hypothetical protein
VRIEPMGPEGRQARITLAWHDAFPVGDASAVRETSRIDIGVFASNGATDSAPAFVSVSFPTHEARLYGPAEGGVQRLLSVDYDALGRDTYYDPELHWSAFWRDEAVHGGGGERVAWRRRTSEGEQSIIQDPARDLHYRIDRTWPRTPVLRVGALNIRR